MNIKELREYLNFLPTDINDYNVVLSEIGEIDEEHIYRMDSPILEIFIDDNTKEMCIVYKNKENPDE